MNKKLIGWIAGAILVVLVLYGAFRPAKVIVQPSTTNPPQYGALASNDVQSSYFRIGGVTHYYQHTSFNTSSTTVCSLPAPIATSTLRFASVTVSTATSSQIDIDIAKSAGTAATTTLFTDGLFAAGTQGTLILASTTVGTPSTGVLDPVLTFSAAIASSSSNLGDNYVNRQFLNFKYGGYAINSGSTSGINGTCQAEWVINN